MRVETEDLSFHSGSSAKRAESHAEAAGELTFDEFCQAPMEYRFGMSGDKGARRLYRNDALGIQKEVFTKRNPRTMEWGYGEAYYFVDGDTGEYRTPADLYVAYMRKVCGVPEAAE
jgi:hypothetical protein